MITCEEFVIVDGQELYEASIELGFKILPDSFGGFGLVNHTGKTLKHSL